jgi:ABC-2 type transport system permease protein
MNRLVRLELLKLRRRWLIWILLGLLVAGEALTIFGGYYLAVSGTMTFLDERGQILPIEMVLPNFILPGALRAVLGLAQQVGSWLLVILTAVVIGMEEAYGTLRQILISGIGRTRYLVMKLITLFIVVVSFVGTAVISGMGFALIVANVAEIPITPTPVEGSVWLSSFAMAVRTIVALTVPVVIAFVATLLSRSQTIGIAIGLVYFLAESVVNGLLALLGEAGQQIALLLPGTHIQALMAHNQFNSQGLIPGYLPSQPIAGLVLLSYILVLLGIAWALFVRRDIRSGSSQ